MIDSSSSSKYLSRVMKEKRVSKLQSTATHHSLGSVVCSNVVQQVLARDGVNVVFRAQNGVSKRGSLKGDSVQMIKHDLFLVLVDLERKDDVNKEITLPQKMMHYLFSFTVNNSTLPFNGSRIKSRAL